MKKYFKKPKKLLIGAAVVVAVLLLAFFLQKSTPSSIQDYEPVVSQSLSSSTPPLKEILLPTLYDYIEVVDSCGPYYQGGACVNMRFGPGTEYPIADRLRNGTVLKVAGKVTDAQNKVWYKIDPGTNLRYPERVLGGWYVLADAVRAFKDDGDHRLKKGDTATTTKRILVDLATETLSAYDGDTLFMQEPISTGLNLTPTPLGTFTIYAKTPSRYMQGPISGVSDQVYDLPGVPWDLYFTQDGAVIHGAYWHDHFGQPWSHGCVNLSPEMSKKLYYWADIGTPVTVIN